MAYTVTLIPGDGIGPEVTGATQEVLRAAGAPIEWEVVHAGMKAFEETGEPVPAAVLKSIRKNRVGLKGPLQTPKGKGFRSANVTIRQELQLYTGLRPVKTLPGIETPYTDVDLVVLRENTEDLYAGIEHEVMPGHVISLKVSTRAAGERIAKWAFEYMRYKGRRKISCCAKPHISPMADGAFIDAFQAVGQDYPFIAQDMLPIDNLSMALAMDPMRFDVLLLQNLYGDIISDLCAGLVGGLGVVPGANVGDRIAVFEAVHGTAPDIEGKGIANPLAVLSSGVMMLEFMGEQKIADRVNQAIWRVLEAGKKTTGDLGGPANTAEFTAAIIEEL
ncbi:MAG: isocitrate/isopropylmalate dehydrogenase family protein [Proteobacteria bacterium]|nr:isocitrate/isopropylmalate dehydrogenase family protein [Pseudomonadota bacterium]MCP4916526.1 isocitrate/isopropylmalate dehydrogenase family protein [Pseudomonadota bacterium]